MSEKKTPAEKTRLHPRNKHREHYDFKLLIEASPELSKFITKNKYGNETVDFFNPDGVKALNKSLLIHHYGLKEWDIPAGYLCPPIPGRADYIHHIADILAARNFGKIPTGSNVKCLDIGTGANLVYPIVGNSEYGWSFVGTDIDPKAIESAESIVKSNPSLEGKVEVRLQAKADETFFGAIQKGEKFDLTICNPPFHSSAEDAHDASQRKLNNLKQEKVEKVELNFGGTSGELWTEGGEKAFILRMIQQSSQFAKTCCYFSTLVSKQSNVKHIKAALEKIGVMEQRMIPMGQGNKTSRIIVWTYLKKFERKEWAADRWKE
ncbi:MAG: 23S rRNA (adenine(1618)-N(6))-methyltransferase RlmF [Crocinitomicaceae bacterium]|nr:23S rRNA (adenine(1618)-N(6))-methyltransferase RlmF [Flavobacteriales bacterium]NQZ34734.1 23S rRNA (adenine(1618)-N(6))-methyltransferase RlmF [Crocinitomicaceae bacterium]PHR35624.1 MAG: 23S rRNA (adenine(1618)-N(6))-methyltransferase RlmF [Fluviicola sp.]